MRGAGIVKVQYIPTDENTADLFTKVLKRQPFEVYYVASNASPTRRYSPARREVPPRPVVGTISNIHHTVINSYSMQKPERTDPGHLPRCHLAKIGS